MKRLLTLALAFATLAALIGLGVAQQQKAGLNNPTGGLPTPGQTAPPGGTIARCPQRPGVEYLGGVVDDFLGGDDPVTTSPELEAFLNSVSPPRRQFDEGGANKYFGHSFQLRENCKVCNVRFEIKMRDEDPNGLSDNDTISIFGRTITSADQIWQAPTGATGSGAPGTFTLIAFLPPAAIDLLNQHIVTNAPGHWLNIVAQDDHAFDYVKVTITYY